MTLFYHIYIYLSNHVVAIKTTSMVKEEVQELAQGVGQWDMSVKAKIKYMSVSGNVLKKITVGQSENTLFYFFILFWNSVKCKNVVLICHIAKPFKWSLKVIGQNLSYTQCQSWPWHLTLSPKINRVPPLIIQTLQVKFESDWAKSVVTIMSTRSYTQCQSWPWPLNLGPKISGIPPLIIQNLHEEFESGWAKTVVATVSTRSYTQSAKVDLDLWLGDPKSIGLLLSSSTTYMWSLKEIGQKL